jgi:hypothetical protein
MSSATSPLSNLLTNSTTKVLKSTYVPLIDSSAGEKSGRAIVKSSFIGSLRLQAGEVDAVRSAVSIAKDQATEGPDDVFWSLVRQYEGFC